MNAEYKKRRIRFLELYAVNSWVFKMYSITSGQSEVVSEQQVTFVKENPSEWLEKSTQYALTTYNVGNVIIHEGKEGCFAIINWRIDENMLRHFVYLATKKQPHHFVLYSDNGIVSFVWEMAVLWFERNAWVNNVLSSGSINDVVINKYLNCQLNADVWVWLVIL